MNVFTLSRHSTWDDSKIGLYFTRGR
jgi:hypothetical protein